MRPLDGVPPLGVPSCHRALTEAAKVQETLVQETQSPHSCLPLPCPAIFGNWFLKTTESRVRHSLVVR